MPDLESTKQRIKFTDTAVDYLTMIRILSTHSKALLLENDKLKERVENLSHGSNMKSDIIEKLDKENDSLKRDIKSIMKLEKAPPKKKKKK